MSNVPEQALAGGAIPTIPLSAAGRDPLFFFGTLMDRDVLGHVLGRPIDPGDLRPGALPGFRRVQVVGRSYPMLVPAPSASVQGCLFHGLKTRDIHRINHFESGEYHAARRWVHEETGTSHEAWLYVARQEVLVPSEAPWTLESWVRDHKAAFFDACNGWMADCPA